MTILYNTQSQQVLGYYPDGYLVNGKPSPTYDDDVVELTVVNAEKPEYTETQKVSSTWTADLQAKTWTQSWQVVDKTEAEIIAAINAKAEQAQEAVKTEATKRLTESKVAEIYTEVAALDTNAALEQIALFPPYRIGVAYTANQRFQYNGELFKVLQNHTSAIQWKPTEAVSLYVKVTPPGVIAAWVQPAGAHDAYQIDDKVTHKSKTWKSTAANNVWEPGVYGWTEI
jgi:ribosomal protein L14E/L6E/L27E